MIDKTKQRIQELVPEVIEQHSVSCHMDESHGYVLGHKDCDWCEITLAVVLRAIALSSKNTSYSVDMYGCFWRYEAGATEWESPFDIHAQWNLAKDNYDDQTQETKDFIGQILRV